MLEFRYLPAFFAAAESKNFTEAGKSLHIATSAVSRQISLLEEACGEQLFFRSAREVLLTDAGKKLYDEMKLFQAGTAKIFNDKKPSTFRIGVLEGVLQNWFLNCIGNKVFPSGMNLDLRVAHPAELLGLVESGDLDASFFSFVHQTRIPNSIKVYRMFREDIVLISSKPISLEDIDAYPWICYTNNTYIIRHQKRLPERFIIVNNMHAIVELVRRGEGISMVPSHVIKDTKGLHIHSVKKFSKEYVYLITRNFDREPQTLSNFKGFLRELSSDWKEIQ